ncbi:hypothetical protein ACLKA6_009518 [Drosophila palustris]
MRSSLILFVGIFVLAVSCALAASDDDKVRDDQVVGLLSLADNGAAHQNEGQRETRAFFGGGGYCCRGGYGRGYGGYKRGGYGYGGYGRGGYGRRYYGR